MSNTPLSPREQAARWMGLFESGGLGAVKFEIEQRDAQIAAEVRASAWMPIEICPTGENVLLFIVRKTGGFSIRTGYLYKTGGCSAGWKIKPTHWMPLPTPPKISNAKTA